MYKFITKTTLNYLQNLVTLQPRPSSNCPPRSLQINRCYALDLKYFPLALGQECLWGFNVEAKLNWFMTNRTDVMRVCSGDAGFSCRGIKASPYRYYSQTSGLNVSDIWATCQPCPTNLSLSSIKYPSRNFGLFWGGMGGYYAC